MISRSDASYPLSHSAFTLVELLVVITVILILMAMLLPVVRMIHNQSYKNYCLHQINDLSNALEEYRAEDARRLYPTPPNPAGAGYIDTDPTHPNAVMNLLQYHSTFSYDRKDVSQDSTDAWYQCLVDKWDRPIFYQLDGGYMTNVPMPIHLDSHLMNKVADRPVAAIGTIAAGIAPTWNTQGVEPYAYIWGCGIPTSNGDAADMTPANWAQWIYRATSQ